MACKIAANNNVRLQLGLSRTAMKQSRVQLAPKAPKAVCPLCNLFFQASTVGRLSANHLELSRDMKECNTTSALATGSKVRAERSEEMLETASSSASEQDLATADGGGEGGGDGGSYGDYSGGYSGGNDPDPDEGWSTKGRGGDAPFLILLGGLVLVAVGLSVLFSSDSELQQPATAEVGEDTLFDSIDTVPADKPASPPSVNVASSAVSSKFCCTDMGEHASVVPFLISFPRGSSSSGGPTLQAAASLIRSSDYMKHRRHITPTCILANQVYRESNGMDVIDAIDASIAAEAAGALDSTISIIGAELWQHPVRRKLSAFNKSLRKKRYAAKRGTAMGRDDKITKQLLPTVRFYNELHIRLRISAAQRRRLRLSRRRSRAEKALLPLQSS